MSRTKLRIHNTVTDNLVANLRGEVGEVIFTWVLMQNTKAEANRLRSDNLERDLSNPHLATFDILADKLSDEIVARLSELAEQKIGRLTFHFAAEKLTRFSDEANQFTKFVRTKRFEEKRNYAISHKELPEKWSDHKHIQIPYANVLRGVAMALRLMKRIDRAVLGPSAKYLWREMRKRRNAPLRPVKVSYMLLPYLRLSAADRLRTIKEEE